jgi:hypothetical protein
MQSSRRPAEVRSLRAGAVPAALFALATLVASPSVIGQGNKAAAETLFQTGVTLMNEGKFAEACPKFAESQRADPSSGTLLNLGSCYEKTGKTASAWATYKEAAVLARSLSQTDREATANARVAALEPTLSTLRIDAGDIPGLTIERDDLPVGRGSLGVPIAVDPGDHVIEASAPGHKDWSTTIKVGDNADKKTVTVPPLQKLPETPQELPPYEASGSSSMRIAGFVALGVGAAGLGLGGVMGGLALSEKGDADEHCPEKRCTQAGQDIINGASTKALVSTIGFGVGLAGVGAGIALIVLSGPKKTEEAPKATSARVLPSLGPGGGGISVIGRF